MALEDIERLKEKINKDPNSKLFVPLAEEYKKAGMLDEAIEVLVNGLEAQPGYLSARVSLGKIFIDRGMMQEAQAEFEKVIGAIPDNLYAHKKLAEIYRDLGERDKAAREFKTVLKLNPMDEMAATSLSEIEQGQSSYQEEPTLAEEIPPEQSPIMTEEDIFGIPEVEAPDTSYGSLEETNTAGEEKIPEFSFGGGDIDLQGTQPEEVAPSAMETEEASGISLTDADLNFGKSSFEKIQEVEELQENIPEISIREDDRAIWESHAESVKTDAAIGDKREQETPPAEEVDLWKPLYDMKEEEETLPDPDETVVEETPPSFESSVPQKEYAVEESSNQAEEEELQEETAPSVAAADSYIHEGKYFSAMNVYRKILARDPDNKEILQRIEELRALLKLLGKDKEELVSKLDSFLDGIRKRRDEFLGSS